MRMVVLTDIHFVGPDAERVGKTTPGDVLLLRAVERVNRSLKPDLVAILGDLIDDGDLPDAEEYLAIIRGCIEQIEPRAIVLPGNHDGPLDLFQRYFPPPPEWVDIGAIRIVPFIDPEVPEFCARRQEQDHHRLANARAGHTGPLVTLQHVPISPPGMHECPFNYANADEVITGMKESGVSAAISGHYHEGFDLESEGIRYICAPALFEPPFSFLEIELADNKIWSSTHRV